MRRERHPKVVFEPGQFVGAADLNADTTYHDSQRRSHNLTAHGAGVLSGLALEYSEDERRFFVHRGIALAGDGTEIRLEERYSISLDEFERRGSDVLEVYLVYERVTVGGDGGYRSCTDGPGRPRSELVRPRILRETPGSRSGPLAEIRVGLGRIIREFTGGEATFTTDTLKRELARLVGGVLEAASGRAKLEVGVDPKAPVRVLVSQASEDAYWTSGSRDCGCRDEGDDATRESTAIAQEHVVALEITDANHLVVHGDATVTDTVRIRDGALQFRAPNDPASLGTPESREWVLRRVREPKAAGDELQLLLAEDANGSFAIGRFDADAKQFVPIFEIRSDGTTHVAGDLIVHGGFKADYSTPELSPAAERALFSGVLAGGPKAAGELELAFDATAWKGASEILGNLLATSAGRQDVIGRVEADYLDEFADEVATFMSAPAKRTLSEKAVLSLSKEDKKKFFIALLNDEDVELLQESIEAFVEALFDELVGSSIPRDLLVEVLGHSDGAEAVADAVEAAGLTGDNLDELVDRILNSLDDGPESVGGALASARHADAFVVFQHGVREKVRAVVDALATTYPDDDESLKNIEDLADVMIARAQPWTAALKPLLPDG